MVHQAECQRMASQLMVYKLSCDSAFLNLCPAVSASGVMESCFVWTCQHLLVVCLRDQAL